MYTIQVKRFGNLTQGLNLYIGLTHLLKHGESDMKVTNINVQSSNTASNQCSEVSKTIFVFYYSIYTFTASKKVNLI